METVQASALNVDPRYGPGVVSNGGVNCGGTRTSSNDRNEKVPSRAHKIDSQASTASLSSSSSPTSSSAMTSHQNVGPSSSSSGTIKASRIELCPRNEKQFTSVGRTTRMPCMPLFVRLESGLFVDLPESCRDFLACESCDYLDRARPPS